MEISIVEIWHEMGLLARLVAISLVVMGLSAIIIGIERTIVVARGRSTSRTFSQLLFTHLNSGESPNSLVQSYQAKKVPLALLIQRVINDYERPGAPQSKELHHEQVRRGAERGQEEMSNQLRRGMNWLASVGSTSPFIGLFGTVLGIITAFQGIAASGGGGIEAVSAGIAEALIVTAVGLLVAIFSVLVFNRLNGQMELADTEVQHSVEQFLDRMES